MKKIYIIIAFGILIVINTIFMYLMILEKMESFITQFKWFMRVVSPFIMIYLIYIGTKK